jgi:hypothetical protein
MPLLNYFKQFVYTSFIRILAISAIYTFYISLFTANCQAQQGGIIRGFVYEKVSGAPVAYINVYLHKTQIGAMTNESGYFTITKIPAGTYTLMVTSIGYDTLRLNLNVKNDEAITRKLYLSESVVQLRTVNISGERQEDKTETKTSLIKITPRQISQIPSIGGQADLAQYLQVLPGVIFTGDQGGQLYIRGGSPVQNEVLLDGMIIYNPFHSIGLFSVFDTDVLRNVDVYTGGFGAEYGDRISSVMDVRTRSGNKKRFAGKADVSTFGSRLMLEGPMKKQTDSTEGNSSFILSAKNSYLSKTSDLFYKYANDDGLPFDYTDIYGKLSFESTNGSQFNIFGFQFDDKVTNYKELADFNWKNTGVGSNFLVIPGKSPVIMEGVFAYSDYKVKLDELNNAPRTSEINGFNLGLHFTYFLGKDAVKYGLELLGIKTIFNFHNSVNRVIEQTGNSTEFGSYIKYKFTGGKFIVEPSFRAHYYASLSAFSPEPRLAVKYNLADRVRLKFAGGLYAQNLISATYDQDVVNLFYGFITSPDVVASSFEGTSVKNDLQKAQHAIFGVEYDLSNNISINIEAYYKNFSELLTLNRNKIYDENDPNSYTKPENLVKDFVIEKGDAEGIDFSIKYEDKQLYVWGVYSLGYVNRYDGINEYVPYYDRRHNANIVASYRFGKALQWEFNVRWNLGSGFPFTKTQGIYEKLDFSQAIQYNYTNTNGNMAFLYDKYNGGRLPYYHRLDLSMKRKFYLGKNSALEANFSLTNVYDRKNIFFTDRITQTNVYQLPILPSFGINLTF